ncbi:hypothetical protein CTEN210_13315 [Chaetoceros tenuissimus]|uniref:Kinesin light chain n=1 Tax=Chaetoceros tenuissimus TaxID=426638 RepID=A0AAD3HBB1_9STRA|nr:hypothetical protein CTEN210_13315 [Chaetoceros tenuissimus]
MPPDEKKAFLNAMENSSEGIDQLYSFLAKTRVENAQASVEEDRVRILKLIEEGPGYDTLNHAVNDCLRDWLKQVIVIEVESRERNSSNVQHDLDLARLYSVVAEILFRNGEKDQSLQLFEKALNIHKSVYGEEHESTATTYNSIGVNLKHLERYDEAIEAYSKAALIREKVLGKNSPECASTYNNLGSLYSKMNRYNDGLEQFQKALDIRIHALGKMHADVANSYSNIGGALYQLGRYKEAQIEHKKGLDIKLKLYGEDHPDTAASYENIGLVYKEEGDTKAAIENLEKAYSIRAIQSR